MQKNIPTSNKYLTQVHPCRRNFLFFILIWIHLGHGLDTKEKKIEKKGRFFTIQHNLSLSCFGMSEISHLFSICNSLTLNLARWHCSVRYGSALSLLYCQATLGLSQSHLSRPVFTPRPFLLAG